MITGPPAPRRTRLLSLGLLAITFLVGALSGAALDRVLSADPAPAEAPVVKAPTQPEARNQRRRERKFDDIDGLDLSAEQRARIDAILERRKLQIDEFWKEAGPRLRALVDSTRAEIREELTPAQQAEYDRRQAERHARSRADRDETSKENESQ